MNKKEIEKINRMKYRDVQQLDCATLEDFVKSGKKTIKYRGTAKFVDEDLVSKKCKKSTKK